MKNKKQIKYYQPELYFDDGTNIGWQLPEELNSCEVFSSKEAAEDWLSENGYDNFDYIIHEYQYDGISEITFLE